MPARRIWLDEVCDLLDAGQDIDAIAARLGVHPDAIARAAARNATPTQRATITAARAAAGERKRRATAERHATRRNAGANRLAAGQ